jgi:LPS sulfotransferase NodH
MKHQSSYTIWFSQRTGSTLLGTVLEKTSIAGKPREWFNFPPDLLSSYRKTSHAELQEYLFNLGSTSNGVLGINHSYYEPHFTQLIETLRKFPACPPDTTSRTEVWEHIFPNHRHIFMSRRNKIRLAVSWWRAIQSGEWHVQTGGQRKPVDLSNA